MFDSTYLAFGTNFNDAFSRKNNRKAHFLSHKQKKLKFKTFCFFALFQVSLIATMARALYDSLSIQISSWKIESSFNNKQIRLNVFKISIFVHIYILAFQGSPC